MFYIYTILNLINYKVYVGQTQDLQHRWSAHKCEANADRLHYPLYKALRKYGLNSFQISVVEAVEIIEQADQAEQYWIQYFESRSDGGYNLTPGGLVARGWHHTEESKEKIAKGNTGRSSTHTVEGDKKISEALYGHVVTNETRQKISIGKIGRPHSEETKDNISKSQIGRKHSDATKKKMSEASLGKKKSEQAKVNMSKAKRRYSLEQERKIVKLFSSGCSVVKLSEIYICTRATVYNILKRSK